MACGHRHKEACKTLTVLFKVWQALENKATYIRLGFWKQNQTNMAKHCILPGNA